MSNGGYLGLAENVSDPFQGNAVVRLHRIDSGQRRSIRRDPPPLDPALMPCDDPLYLHLAEELDYVRRMLDQLGNELAADTLAVMRHSHSLQWLDIAGQILGHVASVTRAAFPDAAVDRIGMTDLKARLTRRPADQG